jgi:membrane-associated phospholipid phosphatase
VAAHGPLWRWDLRADADVLSAAARHPGLTPCAQVLADLGNLPVALPPLALVLGYVGWRTRRWPLMGGYAGLLALSGVVVVPMKAAVGRPAPGTAVLAGHSGYFPSGHAVTAAMAYGLAVLAVSPAVERAAARRLLVLAAVPLNLAVGAALVWRGYHWPLDVLAGWCLCWVLLGSASVVRAVRSSWGSPG